MKPNRSRPARTPACSFAAPLAAALLVTAADAAPPAGGTEARRFAPELMPRIAEAFQRYNAVSRYPLPELGEKDREELLAGGVVRLLWMQPVPGAKPGETDDEKETERHRVVALSLIAEPRLLVWLSAMDPHYLASDKITEHRLRTDGKGTSTWYQFIDLPWPVRNRHWVIDVTKEAEVARGTGGQAWEQSWNLVRGGKLIAYELASSGKVKGIDLARAREARYLHANTGAWTMFELEENVTLLAYQLTIVLGGWIPPGLAAKFAMSTLEELCRTVEKNAALMRDHYVAGHEPTFSGEGLPIPPFPAPGGGAAAPPPRTERSSGP
jgi:hypothetical protein